MLGIGCARRTGRSIMPGLLPISTAIAGVIAFVAWLALRALDPSGRPATVACLALVGAYRHRRSTLLAVRRWWRTPVLSAGGT